MENCNCTCRKKDKARDSEEYKKLVNRLSRIEGQIRGIRKMLDEDAYCVDILTQVSAVNSALNSFSRIILSDHIHTCVVDEIKQGKENKIDELMDIMKKFMK